MHRREETLEHNERMMEIVCVDTSYAKIMCVISTVLCSRLW